MRLIAGRDFRPSDAEGTEPVLIVNESLARIAWPGRPAIGQCLVVNEKSGPCNTVVGVVSDANLANLTEAGSPHYYLPMAQMLSRLDPKSRAWYASAGSITVRAADERRRLV